MSGNVLEIMHKNRRVAKIDMSGRCKIYYKSFMPYNLYLEEEEDIDTLVNNITNFYYWCATRVLTLDRKYAKDLSTNGVFPKAWKRTGKGFSLLKDGGQDAVERELLASRICQCFKVNQVIYDRGEFDHEPVTVSKNITSQEISITSMEAFAIYAQNHEKNIKKYILALDGYNYYMMNIVDYLIGNTDRHWGNWGVLVNNVNNKPISLHPLMDFNQSFQMYDSLDGANCQTCFGERMNQKQAALQAVERVGLNQICSIKDEWFQYFPEYMEMFKKRLDILKR